MGGRGLREEMLALSCGATHGATHHPLEWPLGLLAVSGFTWAGVAGLSEALAPGSVSHGSPVCPWLCWSQSGEQNIPSGWESFHCWWEAGFPSALTRDKCDLSRRAVCLSVHPEDLSRPRVEPGGGRVPRENPA